MRSALLVLLMTGCGDGALFVSRPWTAEKTVVLLATDEAGTPLGSPAIATGAKVELEVDAEPPFVLYAWVFAPEVLASSCPIGIGGEGLPVPAQREVFVAAIDGEDSTMFTKTEPPSIDVKTTCIVPLPCPQATVSDIRLDELAGANVSAILALSGEKLLVAGDQWTRILELDGVDRRMLDTSAIAGPIRSLSRVGDHVYGATRMENFRFDLAGESFQVETATVMRGLEPVPGGAPVIFGPFGVREVFEGASSATTAIERVDLDVRQVRMVASDNGLLIDEASMVFWFGGNGWSFEQPGDGGLTIESFRRADGDESSFMIVGKRENAFLRRDGDWQQLPPPFMRGISFNDVESLGQSNYVIVGEFGTAALYRDRLWCTYELGVAHNLVRIAAAPDPRILFVGTARDAEGYPHLLRVTLE